MAAVSGAQSLEEVMQSEVCSCRFHVTISASLATHKVCHCVYVSLNLLCNLPLPLPPSLPSSHSPSLTPSLQPEVVELRQQLSGAMTVIQMAVLDIMKSCVAELKTGNPTVGLGGRGTRDVVIGGGTCLQLEMEEVTVEACLGKSFDVIIRHQLDPVWNQLVWNRDISEGAT